MICDIKTLEEKYRVDLQRISELTLIPMPTLYSWHSRVTPKPFVLNLIDFRLKAYRNGEPDIQVPSPLPTIRELKETYCFTNRSFGEYIGVTEATIYNWCSGFGGCKPYIQWLIFFKLESEKFS